MNMNLQLVIPLAGDGQRFRDKYDCPKPLIDVFGEKMIKKAYDSLNMKHHIAIFIIRTDHDINNILSNEINKFCHNPKIISIGGLTDGPCDTALLAETFLNSEHPLVIANCDQIMKWNGDKFIKHCEQEDYDGAVVTYHETTPKNSYAKINKNGDVIEIREKQPISNISLNGIHYWKKAKYFVESAKNMIQNNDRTNNEFYIAPTYNYMIKNGMRVGIFHIPNEQHNAIGTTQDLEKYIEREMKS